MNPLDLSKVDGLRIAGESVAELRWNGQIIWQGRTIIVRLADEANVKTAHSGSLLLIVPDDLAPKVEALLATEARPAVLMVHPTPLTPEVSLTLTTHPYPAVTALSLENMPIYISEDLNALVAQERHIGANLISMLSAGNTTHLKLGLKKAASAQNLRLHDAEAKDPAPLEVRRSVLAQLEPSYNVRNLPAIRPTQAYVGSASLMSIHPVTKMEPLPIGQKYAGSGVFVTIIPVTTLTYDQADISTLRASSGVFVPILMLPVVETVEALTSKTVSSGTILTGDPQQIDVDGSVTAHPNAAVSRLAGQPENVQVGIPLNSAPATLAEKVQTKGEVVTVSVPLGTEPHPMPQKTITDAVDVAMSVPLKTVLGAMIHFGHTDDTPVQTLVAVRCENSVILEVLDGEWEYPYLDGTKLVIRQAYSAEMVGTKLVIR